MGAGCGLSHCNTSKRLWHEHLTKDTAIINTLRQECHAVLFHRMDTIYQETVFRGPFGYYRVRNNQNDLQGDGRSG
jgi:hypothetical protein